MAVRFSRGALTGFLARPAFSAATASDSEIRPVDGGERNSSRHPPRRAANSASAASCGAAGRPEARASMKPSLRRMASSDGSSPLPVRPSPRISDMVIPRHVVSRSGDLGFQPRQGAMLGHAYGARGAADGLGGLLGGHTHHDPQRQDLALLLR